MHSIILLTFLFLINFDYSMGVGGIDEMKALTGDAPYLGTGNQVLKNFSNFYNREKKEFFKFF